MVKNWSKAKKIKSVRKKVQPKIGGSAQRARHPIFVSYIFEYTLDFFGFGPIFDQFFWDFILKNNSKYKEKAIIIVIIVVIIVVILVIIILKGRPGAL